MYVNYTSIKNIHLKKEKEYSSKIVKSIADILKSNLSGFKRISKKNPTALKMMSMAFAYPRQMASEQNNKNVPFFKL